MAMADTNPTPATTKATNAPVDEWTTVAEGTAEPEIKIVLERMGEFFAGTFLGFREMPSNDQGKGYKQARFDEFDGADNPTDVYFMNANYSLVEGLKNVRPGTRTRITWTDELDTGQKNLMRVYKVETARRGAVRRSS
jgi:hypothetical protein